MKVTSRRIQLENTTVLITVEGRQGSGKTRIADAIQEFALASKINVVIIEKQT